MTKDEVIQSSLWQVTVYAAFQRAKVYSDSANKKHKREIKQTLENEIKAILPKYSKIVSEISHIKNIEVMAKHIDSQWSTALDQGSIPIGVVQKAFNLYLKLMWCIGKVNEPPHCPIDKIIIDKLPYKHRESWTKIRDIETYKCIVTQLKELAKNKNMSLACWELEVYKKP